MRYTEVHHEKNISFLLGQIQMEKLIYRNKMIWKNWNLYSIVFLNNSFQGKKIVQIQFVQWDMVATVMDNVKR